MIQKQPIHRRLGKAERAQQGRLKLHHLFLNRSLLYHWNRERIAPLSHFPTRIGHNPAACEAVLDMSAADCFV